ncbi:MAG: hypothetical protein IKZ91_03255 [Bacteroidales bacterium]|nr:hypothetical protein [Bacteroidales bacterium]
MKRFVIILATLAAVSISAGAQDSYYAEMLSRNNYYGTARSIGLGGAMTALGGDLGSVMYNPAGSAVNDFCQFTISPGVLVSAVSASYDPTGLLAEKYDPTNTSHAKFNLPNLGLNLVFFSDEYSWITSMSMGLIANTTNTFLGYTTARGVNSSTSFLGSLAAAANGSAVSKFGRDLAAAYDGNQIGEYGPVGSNRYVGANQVLRSDEAWAYVPGPLNQAAIYNTYGTKTDIAFNMGFNVQDNFYFGFNIGFPTLNYRREEIFQEAAQTPEQFPVIFYYNDDELLTTHYLSSTNTYRLNTNGVGVNARFGFIGLIADNVRVGAAIQTPTAMNIEESWEYRASSSYEMSIFDSSAESSIGTFEYNLRTPYIVDAGIAYTVPGLGLLSLDYELTDYSVVKYSDKDSDYFGEDSWSRQNYINRTFLGLSHSVRAGVEFKPVEAVSLRAGYSFVSDPEKYWFDSMGNRVTAETWQGYSQVLESSRYFTNVTHAMSLGIGYSSPGSFFADFAVRLTAYPKVYYSPYYYGSYDAVGKDGQALAVADPLVSIDRKIIDSVLTLGWRF